MSNRIVLHTHLVRKAMHNLNQRNNDANLHEKYFIYAVEKNHEIFKMRKKHEMFKIRKNRRIKERKIANFHWNTTQLSSWLPNRLLDFLLKFKFFTGTSQTSFCRCVWINRKKFSFHFTDEVDPLTNGKMKPLTRCAFMKGNEANDAVKIVSKMSRKQVQVKQI